LTETDEQSRRKARGWLGVARDLVASVVEQRLNLHDAAELIRSLELRQQRDIPPVATVTLAEIYAAQGHVRRAIKLLDEVLAREPDHPAATHLRSALLAQPVPGEETEVSEVIGESQAPGTPAEALDDAAPNGTATGADDIPDTIEEPSIGPAATADESAAPVTNASDDSPPVSDGWVQQTHLQALESAACCAHAAIAAAPISAAATADMLVYRRSTVTVGCHWRVRARTWEHWQSRNDGQWTLRVVRVVPTERQTTPRQVDMPMAGSFGEVLISDVAADEEIRMALGWLAERRFYPCVLGVEISGESANDASVAWEPLAGLDDPEPAVWLEFARQNLFKSAGAGAC
jgi:hypothetical protein